MNEQLDQDVVALAKAVREKEGNAAVAGQSGEFGNYQYTPDTWRAVSQKHLGRAIPLEQATIQDQNEATYRRFKSWKDAGYNPGQIASMHNAGEGEPDAYTGVFSNGKSSVGVNSYGVKYDVPSYAKGVAEKYQSFKGNSQPVAPVNPVQEPSGALFPAREGEGAMAAGLKTLGNTPGSLWNFAKATIDAVNPISTIGRLAEIPGVLKDIASQKQTPGQLAGNLGVGAYEALVPQAGRQLIAGDTVGAQKSITEDPFGQVAPFVLGARGGAGLADSAATRGNMRSYVNNIGENTANRVPIPGPSTKFVGAFDNAVSTVGGPGAKIVGAPFKLAGNVAGKTLDYGIKQATGLSGETRKVITDNPEAFTTTNRGATDRVSTAKTIREALDERISSLGESQAAYKPIRAQETAVKVDPAFIEKAVSETAGVTFKNGKIQANGKSTVREARDIASLQQLYDFWNPYFKKGTMTPDLFLNFRADLAKAAKYGRDIGASKPVQNVANVVRGKLNTAYRDQIKGLKELDLETSTLIKEFKEVKKGILDKDNNLTEGAINRIANATNKGRDKVLEKLEEISPGITKQIQIVKAIEDIEAAGGNKAGTYGRAIVGAGSVLTLNIPGIVATILAQPEVAVPVLRQYGYAKPLVNQVLKSLKEAAGNAGAQMNKPMELPSKLPGSPKALGTKESVPELPGQVQGKLDKLFKAAPKAKVELDAVAQSVADKHGATVAQAPLKSMKRALEKVTIEYGGDTTKIVDIARNTIVAPGNKRAAILADLQNLPGKTRVKEMSRDTDLLGYEGVIANVKASNGHVGEIQVASPGVIYGKMLPEDSVRILGKETFDRIRKETGIEPGLGHKFYEEFRELSDADKVGTVGNAIAKNSKSYYNKLYDY